ncbi:MAG: leucyl/phenylalanyl-tRNA--protein transferase [Bdellovibrionaceae bacterium]|jgi:leucyl/phenylalanyl-tRNA---protein transferase|nr:leucyl/phenylalanyl-tRNA--protein transferase [Pseudobdellovibrionaceae bacterium]
MQQLGETPLFKNQREMFPDPKAAYDQGLLAVSREINTEMLFESYSFGIFPWPHEGYENLWFCPDERGVLLFKELKFSKTLKKLLRQNTFRITFNESFNQVIDECAVAKRKEQDGTWITDDILTTYKIFHKMGYAHSVECWQNEELVGGMYGVYVAGVFSGESMFFKTTGASKVALLSMIELLQKNGQTWMDIQMVTPFVESIGGKYVEKSEYLEMLAEQKKQAKKLFF